MKTRFVTFCVVAVAIAALAFEGFAIANLQQETTGTPQMQNMNSNTSGARRGRRPRRPPKAKTEPAPQAAPETAPPETTPPATTPRGRGQRRGGRASADLRGGVPSGVDNCLNTLARIAARDPLPNYEGRPSQIINNGLLWNDPKSKCSVGDDATKRAKIFELANAWRMKDASKVRSILQELGASSGM